MRNVEFIVKLLDFVAFDRIESKKVLTVSKAHVFHMILN